LCLTTTTVSDHDDGEAVEEEPTPLQRALDLLVFAPVGVALTVVEDLPGLIGKGRQRFETDVQNARVVGQFVVTHGQRRLRAHVGKLFQREPPVGEGAREDASHPTSSHDGAGTPAPPTASAAPRPDADPADVVIVEGALAGYDTLSASQVVRRLESLGPDELRALHRHEASHRNRRTILNRAHQILEAVEAGGSVLPPPAPSRQGPRTEGAPAATSPPAADAPEPDRSGG